jgi:hypothetical protein
MLLIGFAGIGFVGYRRTRRLNLHRHAAAATAISDAVPVTVTLLGRRVLTERRRAASVGCLFVVVIFRLHASVIFRNMPRMSSRFPNLNLFRLKFGR